MKKLTIFIAPILAIIVAECFKYIPQCTDFYVSTLYPYIMSIIHVTSCTIPFSIYDVMVVASVVFLLSSLIFIWIKSKRAKFFRLLLATAMWLYAWFYLVWGINYFAPDFYNRNGIEIVKYDSLEFNSFLLEYRDSLNSTYSDSLTFDSYDNLQSIIEPGYSALANEYQLESLPSITRPKRMLYPKVYASVGILGYYGPLLAEVHTNPLVEPQERAYTLAHEYAHLLGITSEAEANLYAYLLTTRNNKSSVRFSGYFAILSYVLRNAKLAINDNDYISIIESINPNIFKLYSKQYEYWKNMKIEVATNAQRSVQNTYLKVNRIPQGITNYSEVLGLILSVYHSKRANLAQ